MTASPEPTAAHRSGWVAVRNDDICFAGAFEQARMVRAGDVSAVELVSATLRRIERVDPCVRAYRVVLGEAALAEARRFDAGSPRDTGRPLGGVPVAIKDDTDVLGEVTAWGTDAYGRAADSDAEVVRRLRAAGAIVIGKTHVPEMTAWPWTSSPTWGHTRNPWDTSRTPGGSSGGSACAAATGMCGVALGSDGGGSVRYPAALTGLFGLKPQRDRIPLAPHVGAWHGMLVYGPLSRTVRDAALVLDAIGGTDTLRELERPRLGLRVGVSLGPPRGSLARLRPEASRAVTGTAELLAQLGHDIVDREVDYGPVMRQSTVRYLSGVHQDVSTMPRPERLAPSTRRLARLGRVAAGAARRAEAREGELAMRINQVFDDVDVLLTPMAGAAPRLDDVGHGGVARSLRHSNVAAWAVPWNVIGQPAASVPAGFDADGLPLSVQLCGPPDSESLLLNLAAQIETARPWSDRRPSPEASPTTGRPT
jgi:amidase